MSEQAKKFLWLAVRVVVSVLCIGYVIWKVEFRDTVHLGAPPPEGTALKGWIDHYDPDEGVTFTQADGRQRRISVDEIARDPASGQPLVVTGFLHAFKDLFSRGTWPWFVVAVVFYFLSPVFGAVRWRMLLGVQGIRLSVLDAWRLTYIGFFFNTFMLGVTGGDVIKAYYAAKVTHHRKAEVVTTVFLDRVIGILALALLCLGAIAFAWTNPDVAEARRVIVFFLGTAALGALVFYSHRIRRLLRIDALLERLPLGQLLKRLNDAVFAYRYHPLKLVASVLLSWGAHVTSIASTYCCARAMGLDDAQWHGFLIYMPVVWIVAAMLPSVGALGVIEAGFQRYFSLTVLGVATTFEAGVMALILALLFRAAMFAAVLPGGLLNILSPDVSAREAREHIDDATEPGANG